MKISNLIYVLLFLIISSVSSQDLPIRPVHTYSIVARDSVTGEMGVAVQSNWFSVGSSVTWAEAGVGAVATQSFIDPSYGPLGLDLMRAGKTANEALEALLSIDSGREVRQVAMVDVHGNVAVHTGNKCIIEAGNIKGAQFSCQANLMEKNTVWGAMAKAYKSTKGDLTDKFMAALEAAQAEGGDIRGKQSAAILIVPGKSQGSPWREKVIDLRIEDHKEPIKELRRLIKVHRAYLHMNKGDEYLSSGDVKMALEEYGAAKELYPENLEIIYWAAITMAGAGQVDNSLPLFKEVFSKDKNWMELTKRLPHADLLPNDPELIKKILSVK